MVTTDEDVVTPVDAVNVEKEVTVVAVGAGELCEPNPFPVPWLSDIEPLTVLGLGETEALSVLDAVHADWVQGTMIVDVLRTVTTLPAEVVVDDRTMVEVVMITEDVTDAVSVEDRAEVVDAG